MGGVGCGGKGAEGVAGKLTKVMGRTNPAGHVGDRDGESG